MADLALIHSDESGSVIEGEPIREGAFVQVKIDGKNHDCQSAYDGWTAGPYRLAKYADEDPVPEGKTIVSTERILVDGVPTIIRTLADIVIDLVAYASEIAWQTRVGGVVINGTPVKTDGDSVALIGSMYQMAKDFPEKTFDFISASGPVTLNSTEAMYLAKAVGDWVQNCFTRLGAVLTAIAAGQITTTAEIDAAFVDVTDGWTAA